ncbi:hypothetical protein QTP88_016730 [Uroleucon formosanum]
MQWKDEDLQEDQETRTYLKKDAGINTTNAGLKRLAEDCKIWRTKSNFVIQPTTGNDNWETWKFQIKVIMTAADIFDIVTGESKKPILTKSSSETEDEARKRYGVNYSIFKKADNKAQKYIVTSVDEQPLQYIMNCDTAKEMWDKLLSVYE